MNNLLEIKIKQAVRLLRAYNDPNNPIELAYSGGKDSDVILQLAKEANINFRAIYKNTTIDPPGTLEHVKKMGVKIIQPKVTFFELLAEKGFPNRNKRFCCDKLKEYKILDTCIQGMRREESRKRAENYQEPTMCRFYGSKKNHVEVVMPILTWTMQDVSEFIADRGIMCAPVYYDANGAFHPERRLGCLGCPLASKNKRIREFEQYPNLVKCYVQAGRKFMKTHPNSKVQKYGDEYAYFFRNLFCSSEEQFDMYANGLFGSFDFKRYLEERFQIKM